MSKIDELLKDDAYVYRTNDTRKCKCGHSIDFFFRDRVSCSWCGRLVYRDKKTEFIEKMKKLERR